MTKDDKLEFSKLITGLADYYKSPISQFSIRIYWNGLKQYDFQAIEKAAAIHTQNPDDAGKFLPKISDFKQILEGRTIDQGALAWSKVDSAVRSVGTHTDVVFDDPVIHRVVMDIGGWIKLGEVESEKDFIFVGKEFVTRYQGYKMRGESPDYPALLIGISSANNGKEGFRGQPPVLIGDTKMAMQVLEGGSNKPVLKLERSNIDVKLLGK